jgi:hypothetical protein
MKNFYVVRLVTNGNHSVQIVKALCEAEARSMMPQDSEIVSVEDKGPV